MSELDIGHGVTIEPRYLEGRLHGVSYSHPKPDGTPCSGAGWVPCKPDTEQGWDVLSVEPLTLSPSLLCRGCGHHGFVRGGRWVPC